MLPRYQIVFISCRTGETLAIIDPSATDDLRYSRTLNDVGTIAISLPADNPYAQDLLDGGLSAVLDNFIEVYRTDPISGSLIVEDTYLLRLLQVFEENEMQRVVIGGYSLNHLLKRRIIDPDTDPLQAGGYSTKAGLASSVMREYVIQQCGAGAGTRAFPFFNVPAIGDFGTSVGRRLRHENLLTVLQGIALANGCDFIVQRGLGKVVNCNVMTIGTDLRMSVNSPFAPYLVLSPLRGNLSSPSLVYDRKDEQNVLYALGQGQGNARKLIKISGDGEFDSPFNRIEFSEDIRTAEKSDALTLFTEGKAKLREKRPRQEFTFDLTGSEPGNTYRNDWDIGTLLTAIFRNFMLELRVTSVEISVSSSGETITPKVTTI